MDRLAAEGETAVIIIPAFSVFTTASGEEYYAIRVTRWSAFWVRLWRALSRLWAPLLVYRQGERIAAYLYEQKVLEFFVAAWLIRLGVIP